MHLLGKKKGKKKEINQYKIEIRNNKQKNLLRTEKIGKNGARKKNIDKTEEKRKKEKRKRKKRKIRKKEKKKQ